MNDHRRDVGADGTDDIDPHDAHTLEPPHDIGAVARFDQWVDDRFDVLRGREPTDRILYAISELADFSVLWMLIGAARGVVAIDVFEDPEAGLLINEVNYTMECRNSIAPTGVNIPSRMVDFAIQVAEKGWAEANGWSNGSPEYMPVSLTAGVSAD